jgi:transposase
MGAKIDAQSDEAEKAVRDIRRATRRHFSAEDKVRIVIAGLRDEESVAELCRKEGSTRTSTTGGPRSFWSRARSGWRAIPPEKRPATRSKGWAQARQLKELMAELMLENRLLKKACWRMGSPIPEVRGGGEAGDYRLVEQSSLAGAPYPGAVRHPALDLLWLVRSLSQQ